MSVREYVTRTLTEFNDQELELIAEYLAFLKFRARGRTKPQFDAQKLESLYAEFAAEDHFLAEAGIEDYQLSLEAEDAI